jgi:hypothetical protein
LAADVLRRGLPDRAAGVAHKKSGSETKVGVFVKYSVNSLEGVRYAVLANFFWV